MTGFFAILLFASSLSAQMSPGRMIKEGDRYYDLHLYRAALKFYKQAGSAQTWNKKTKLKVGIAEFEVNDLEESTKILLGLEEQGKTDPLVFLYLAKNYQHRDNFQTAIKYYKQFLRRKKTEETTRSWVKDEIRRCANGIHLKYGQEKAYVENVGSTVNTFQDEFDPIPSSTYMDRLYFSSNRVGSTGGKMNAAGQTDNFFGDYRSDIYTLDQVNGSWETIEPMQGDINTPENEVLYDISPGGQILYYLKGNQILTDTFDNDASRPSRRGVLKYPVSGSDQDIDLEIFSDTIMLFASNRDGGFGGYDLYITVFRNGQWGKAQNLGKNINSFYDERYPFLASDGRRLFFSSNNLKSIGGLDIFTSRFDDRTASWSTPVNMGMPINSANDDFSFKLRKDGLSAFLASNRKTSFGGSDIFLAYFKDQIREHLIISDPVTFYQARELTEKKKAEGETEIVLQQDQPQEIKEYFISDLFYEGNDVILTPQNIKTLDLIANMMLIYPKITLETICHGDAEGPDAFNLYFSVKKAEKVRDYLVKKGVKGNRVTVRGAGNKYPLAKTGNSQSPSSPLTKKLNNRIDLRFHNYETEPVRILKDKIQIPDNVEDNKGRLFNIVMGDLYYQVEILNATQMFQNEIIETEPHAMIEFDADKNRYIYNLGLAQTYASAKEQRDRFILAGFKDAKIYAYLNGSRLERHQLIEHADKYPDLLNFFEK